MSVIAMLQTKTARHRGRAVDDRDAAGVCSRSGAAVQRPSACPGTRRSAGLGHRLFLLLRPGIAIAARENLTASSPNIATAHVKAPCKPGCTARARCYQLRAQV